MKEHHLDTLAVHAGSDNDPFRPLAPPIVTATTFAQPRPGAAGAAGRHEYTRASNPNRDSLEAALAALEGGAHGIAFASGCAALETLFSTLRPGDRIVASADLYGGTYRLLDQVLGPRGITTDWVEIAHAPDAAAALDQAIDEATKLVVVESPTNPVLRVLPVRALAEVTRARGVRLAVDNTFATPFLQRPLDLGADVVVHSTTKFINGHSDVLGGVIITSDDALASDLRFLQKAVGAVPSPFDCAMTMRGLKTLGVRMARHCETAALLAERLAEHDAIDRVLYPGLPDHAGHAIATEQMRGYGGVVSASVAGGLDGTTRFLEHLRLFTLAESLGGVESLVAHPATMSHVAMPRELRVSRGIDDGLVRLSVGLEHVDDLWADLDRALGGA